jgi:hypothetical protein
MRTHIQLKTFLAGVLIPLATLATMTAPQQVMGAGQSKSAAVVAFPQDAHVLTPDTSLSFLPVVTYDSGGAIPFSVVVADVNGDGKPDVMVANSSNGTVGVLLGKGAGTFLPVVLYPSGGLSSESLVAADLNGDGKLDLVVATCAASGSNCVNALVGVLLGNGDGTFQAAVTYSTGPFAANAAIAVAVADLNGDGKADLIVSNDDGAFGLGVLLGNGDGTFQPVVTSSFNGLAFSIATADLNGDGKPDLVLAGCVGSGTTCVASASVLLGKGDGTFQRIVNYGPGGYGANSIAVSDINGDGKLDLLVANQCIIASKCPEGAVGVLLGNGDGTFQPAVSYATQYYARGIAVADVNGDGKSDVLVGNFCVSASDCTSGTVNVLLGNGDGTFQPALRYNSGAQGAVSVAAADVNGDGKPDLIGANVCASNSCTKGTVGVLLNNTTLGKSTTSTSLISSLNPSIYGQKVTWTATVTSSGSITPTGRVNFTWDGYSIGTATLNTSGMATLTRSNLNADLYPLTAVYSGDVNNLRSTSAIVNQMVTETTSAAKITSTPNPSMLGQAVTFMATITSPTVIPTGPVTFMVGTKVLGTAQLSSGKTKFTTSTLPVGSTKVTAIYYGDSNIAKSSASVTQIVH